MPRRGRQAKTGPARAGAPNLALVAARANRRSAGDRMPVRFKHKYYPPSGKIGNQKRQRYIERPGAVDILAEHEETGENEGRQAAHDNLGATAADRRRFWLAAEALERDKGRVQYGIIAELPHEASPEGRLAILAAFQDGVLGKRRFPHWGVIHRPDAHNDSRNYHSHILYYARPGTITAEGWSFADEKSKQELTAGRFPWGTERPGDRVRRLAKRTQTCGSPELRARLAVDLEEARGTRNRPNPVSGRPRRPRVEIAQQIPVGRRKPD